MAAPGLEGPWDLAVSDGQAKSSLDDLGGHDAVTVRQLPGPCLYMCMRTHTSQNFRSKLNVELAGLQL